MSEIILHARPSVYSLKISSLKFPSLSQICKKNIAPAEVFAYIGKGYVYHLTTHTTVFSNEFPQRHRLC